jgi:hypothetical protein
MSSSPDVEKIPATGRDGPTWLGCQFMSNNGKAIGGMADRKRDAELRENGLDI